MGAIEKPIYRLSDGRPIRPIEGSVTQRQLFALAGKFDPKTEGVAKVKDVVDAIYTSRIYAAVMGTTWARTDEYGFFHRNPETRLGKELLWIEDGVFYRIIIPDVPVLFNTRTISLQNVVGGMGIYPSISLLKEEQTGEKEFTVSPVNLDAIAGRVRAMNFMMNDWAEPDMYGFPDGNKPSLSDTARFGWVRTEFDKNATGYHSSFSCGLGSGGCGVRAGDARSDPLGLALVGHLPVVL